MCKTQAEFWIASIPVELPLVSRMQERDFVFAADQLMGENGLFTITVNISDSGVEANTREVEIYKKPASGIPKSDLAEDVQTSLTKADSALQSVPDTYRTAEAQNIIDATKQTKTIADAGGYFGENPTVEGALQQLGANSGGGSGNPNAVLYIEQTLTNEQKAQARSNINAEEAGTSYTKSEIDTKLDEKINASNGKFKNSLMANTANGTQIYQESIDFGSLREGYHVEIKKDGIRCINGSGSLGTQIFSNNRISYLNAPIDDRDAANKKYVDTAKTEALQLGLTAATPGQIIKVKTVQDGKPTEWEAADMDAEKLPKFTKLLTHTITEDELAASPIAFMWGTAQIPNLNDFNVFVLTIVRPDGTKIEFSRWVRLKINNTLLGNICGTSTAASSQYTITANRLFGAWISGNYYDPRNIGVPVLVPPWSSSTFQSNLPDSEPVTSIGFTSYVADYGLTAGIVVEIWGAK